MMPGRGRLADWNQVGNFVVGVDQVAAGSELQRADCAPAATSGDGRVGTRPNRVESRS